MSEEMRSLGSSFKSEYSLAFGRLEKKAIQDEELQMIIAQIKSQLRDSVVLDIGAGEGDAMPKLAIESGAKQYIGVDIIARRNQALEGAAYVTADIQQYLDNPLPEGRHVVVCNGFDREVTNVDYRRLAYRLRDLLKDPDIIFGFEVPSLVEQLLEVKTIDGKAAFKLMYEHRDENFYVIRRRPDTV